MTIDYYNLTKWDPQFQLFFQVSLVEQIGIASDIYMCGSWYGVNACFSVPFKEDQNKFAVTWNA